MKVRMASTDVAAEVACLKQKLLGMRLANMYDLNPKVRPSVFTGLVSLYPDGAWNAHAGSKPPDPEGSPISVRCSPCTPLHACSQTYVLKLSRSGGDGDKMFLLLESGSRFHTTEVRVVRIILSTLLLVSKHGVVYIMTSSFTECALRACVSAYLCA